MAETTRERLIKAGVRNLQEYGYPDASPESLLDVYLFRCFFKSMLNHNLGTESDVPIKALLAEIDALNKAEGR